MKITILKFLLLFFVRSSRKHIILIIFVFSVSHSHSRSDWQGSRVKSGLHTNNHIVWIFGAVVLSACIRISVYIVYANDDGTHTRSKQMKRISKSNNKIPARATEKIVSVVVAFARSERE